MAGTLGMVIQARLTNIIDRSDGSEKRCMLVSPQIVSLEEILCHNNTAKYTLIITKSVK